MAPTLVIANKAYSSWSMRPWLLMRVFEITFDEIVLPLDAPGTPAAIAKFSPAGKLPVLIDGPITIWDSLAIVEFLAERHPDRPIWPRDAQARALARSLCAEMHSGFMPLRQRLPMNMRRPPTPVRDPDAAAEIAASIARVEAAWHDARTRFGGGGPFLFEAFCAADAMFAPLVNRFYAYAVKVSTDTEAYMSAMMGLPAWKDWQMAADAEGWRLERIEAA